MNKQIMFIDDSELDNFIGRTTLLQSGFDGTIIEYLSAKKAIDFLSTLDAKHLFPNLILLDISMPVMDGFAFLSEFEKFPIAKRAQTKIMMLSSTLDRDDFKRCEENSLVLKFISKPLKIKDLELEKIMH